jgi:hypothetical protein
MVGAWFSAALREGIDEWLSRHPGTSQSAFLLDACIEKLKREGIPINESEAKIDRRTRLNRAYASSKLPSAETEAIAAAAERASKRRKS